MSFITRDDFIETYSIITQRGIHFILSKFNFSAKKKTLSAFNELNVQKKNNSLFFFPIIKFLESPTPLPSFAIPKGLNHWV